MKYLPLLLLLATLPVVADDGDDAPLIINGCTIADHSQCPGADLKGANLRNQDLRNMNLSGADLRGADLAGFRLIDADLFRGATISHEQAGQLLGELGLNVR